MAETVRRLGAALALVFSASSVVGCTAEPKRPEVVIGVLIDEGDGSKSGAGNWPLLLDALRDLVDPVLEDRGLPSIRYEHHDTDLDPKKAESKLSELSKEGDLLALVVDGSDVDLDLMKIQYGAEGSGGYRQPFDAPIVCALCTSPEINRAREGFCEGDAAADPAVRAEHNCEGWNYSVGMSSEGQAPVLARLLLDREEGGDQNGDGVLKIAYFAPNDAFGTETCEALLSAVRAIQGDSPPKVVLHAVYHDARSLSHPSCDGAGCGCLFPAFASDLLSAGGSGCGCDPTCVAGSEPPDDAPPDVIVDSTYPSVAALLTRALRASGGASGCAPSTGPLLLHATSFRSPDVFHVACPEGPNEEESPLCGEQGVSFVTYEQGDVGEAFVDLYREALGDPSVTPASFFDAMFVDSIMLATLGVVGATYDARRDRRVLPRGDEVRDAIARLDDPDGKRLGIRRRDFGSNDFSEAVALLADGHPINYEGASGPCDFDNGRVRQRMVHFRVGDASQFEDLAAFDCVASDVCPESP